MGREASASGISTILLECFAGGRLAAGWLWVAGWRVTVTREGMRRMTAPAGWLDGGADGGGVGDVCHIAGGNWPVAAWGDLGGQLTGDGDDEPVTHDGDDEWRMTPRAPAVAATGGGTNSGASRLTVDRRCRDFNGTPLMRHQTGIQNCLL